jgi:uncharacterized protein with FMN-binding domain
VDPKAPIPKSVLADYPLAHSQAGGPRVSSKGSLVALGSAAVLIVYAAGYVHTVPAAHRTELIAKVVKKLPAPRAFKDGTYFGWGSCRHGDLQASVEIKDGRIVAAAIAQCFTRYSKNVIARLPGQVVVRQSADVDQVSRATESSDAFYTAVSQALAQAR